jgi:hypothetical protein
MKKTWQYIVAIVFIALTHSASNAAGLKEATVALTVGNWKVLRNLDPMNDSVSCTGLYKTNNGIQLSRSEMYVSVKGGIQLITLRFDDSPAESSRLPEKMEKDVRAIIIDGADFNKLQESKRLRVQTLTLVSGIVSEDLDLTGLQEALASIKADCPVQAAPVITPAPAPTPIAAAAVPPPPVCSDVLISRMKAQGLKDKQILAVCK